MRINSTLTIVKATAAILFSLPLMLPPALYIGPHSGRGAYLFFFSTVVVFNKVAWLSPETLSFKVVRGTESNLRQQGLHWQIESKESFHGT